MGEHTDPTILPLALVALVLLTGPAAAAPGLTGTLQADGEVGLQGDTEASLDAGVLHLRRGDLAGAEVRLEADAVQVEVTWQEGERAMVLDRETRLFTDRGRTTHAFTDVELTLGDFQGQAEVLAILGQGSEATAEAPERARLDVVHDVDLTQVEWSDSTASTEEMPGFWYHIDGPWVHLAEMRHGTTTGDFDLFVNNVTMAVDAAEGTWEGWTGYDESPPGAPVAHFETRVTVIHVQGGTLTVEAPDGLALLGPNAQVAVDGGVTASQVRGELLDAAHRYVFEDARLDLRGSGALDVRARTAGAMARGALEQPDDPRLELAPRGDYAVQATPGVVASPLPADGPAGLAWTWWALGALLLVAAVAVTLARTPLMRAVHKVRADLRERRVNTWMKTGDRLTAVRDYEKALAWYTRITQRYPGYAEAWYARAVALVELSRFEEASHAYARANDLLGGDDPELLDLAGHAAWRAGQRERASELWKELASVDPDRLRRRLADPATRQLRHLPWVKALLGSDEVAASYV